MIKRIKRIPPPPDDWVCAYIAVLAEAECAAGEIVQALDQSPARFHKEDPEHLDQLVSALLEVASGAVFAAQEIRKLCAGGKPEAPT